MLFSDAVFNIFAGVFDVLNTPNANIADHSVVAWNEHYESEASWASVFSFDKLPQKSLASFAI